MSAKIISEFHQPDLGKICRLCLTEETGTIGIFTSDGQSTMSISMQIMACTALEMHSSDPLPKQICRECRIQLERSYYFRKKSLICDTKLRKHIRLINSGKVSRVFQPKREEYDDDDDDDELKDSLNFLKQIEEDEQEKQQQRDAELEERIRQKLREEEMDRIFEEAKNFFASKISNKCSNKPSALSVKMEVIETEQPSTSSKIEKSVDESTSNPIFENVVDSTEIPYIASGSKDVEMTENACYIVKVGNDNEEEYEVQENQEDLDNDENNLDEYTVVKVNVDKSENITFESLNFQQELENNEEVLEQDPDSDEYNDEHVAFIDSDNSTTHIYTINDHDQELDQQNQELAIDLVHAEEADDDDDDEEEEVVHDQPEGNGMDESKDGYLEELKTPETDTRKQNQSDNDLIQVNNSANAEELKIFKCEMCPQAFTRRAQLNRHASVHQKTRGFQCEYCRKWFACKSSLDRHNRIHTGEKPFECYVCHRRFIQKEILKRHIAVHTGDKPFPCPHCSKSFVQRQMLTSHINLKHTDNPVVLMHECFLCPKSFCHASGLSRHLLTHSGVTYTCKKCGKKFSDKSAVKRHTSSVH